MASTDTSDATPKITPSVDSTLRSGLALRLSTPIRNDVARMELRMRSAAGDAPPYGAQESGVSFSNGVYSRLDDSEDGMALPRSLRALLDGLIDYAGLFPPATLDMQAAVARYARYRAGERAWMLGRFVVPSS